MTEVRQAVLAPPLTEEQEAICSAVALRASHVLVDAGAGCGKTSTMKLAAKGCKGPILGLAFNKRIAEDLQVALGSSAQAKSFNALGHASWARRLGGGKLTLDDRKIGKLITEEFKARKGEKLEDEDWMEVRDLVGRAMTFGLVPEGQGFGLVEDSDEQWTRVADSIDASGSGLLLSIARTVLSRSIVLAKQGTICFDDQIYCPIVFGGSFMKFQTVLADEYQDLSPLNIRMVERSLAPGGKLLVVGDSRQAIYAWRGASGQAKADFLALRKQEPWTILPLLTTFRCPRKIVERQQEHVPGFRCLEGAKDGRVETLKEGWGWQEVAAQVVDRREGLAVICRNNAPLFSLGIKLIGRGIGCRMIGRDLGRGLSAIVKGIAEREVLGRGEFLLRLANWKAQELLLAEGRERKIEAVEDKAACLQALGAGSSDTAQLLSRLKSMFESDEAPVTLSSIHRAKGLEWNTTMFLDPWRVPTRRAKKAGGVELEQEYNMRYVAETRTRDTMLIAQAEEFEASGVTGAKGAEEPRMQQMEGG